MAYETSGFECIWCLDDVKVILKSACRHRSLILRMNSYRNVINIEHKASDAFSVAFKLWQVSRYREGIIFYYFL